MELPGVQQFPILTPGQMSPALQALQSGLSTYSDLTKAAYLPTQLKADIISKAAYGTYAPYQSIAQLLSNPLAFASMSDEQRNTLLKMFGNIPTSVMGGLQGNPAKSSNPLSQLWNAVNPSANQQGELAGTSMPELQNAPQQEGNYTTPSGNQAYSANTPAASIPGASAPNNLMSAAIAKTFPYSPQGIAAATTLKGAEAGASATAHEQAKALQNYLTNTSASSQSAITTLNNIDDFYNNYKAATVKGPLVGTKAGDFISKFDPNAQNAVNAANNVVLSSLNAMLGNQRHTNYGTQLVQNSKVSLNMPEATVDHIVPKQKLILNRIAENTPFNQMEQQYGVNNPNQIQSDFVEYNMKYRLIDKDGNLLSQNLNKYPEFLANKYGKGNAQQQLQSTNQQPQLPVSAGAKLLANSDELDQRLKSFGSKKEYTDWFNQQTPLVQDAVRHKLGKK
jgi:hypothetical protein